VLERRRVTATALFIASFVRRHHFGGWRQVDTLSLSPLSITRIATVGNVLDSRHLLARFPAPLYVGMEIYNSAVLWHCFVASLGDGLMVLLIVAAGWIVLHQKNWFQQPVASGYFVMLTTGFFIAVIVEWFGVSILRRWEYTEKMPMLPGLSIGLIPIVQMLFLPPLIFRIVAVLGSRKMWKSSQ
jgi:hypothetical protein